MGRGRQPRRERGAVAIVLALVTTLVLVPLAGLAVDLGVQRVARRDMQSLADVVALDLARQLDGATTAAQWSTRTPSLQTLADRSSARNTTTAGSAPVVSPTLGTLDASGTFTPLASTSDTVSTAVQVTAGSSVSFGFLPGTCSVSRSAIGIAHSSACYRLGSWAAAVANGDSALLAQLNDLFGFNANQISLASYQGLAAATVTLGQLASTTQFGTVQQLLGSTTTMPNLVAATVAALNTQNNPANAAAISTLGAFTSVGADSSSFKVGDVVGVGPTDAAGLATKIKVLDLLASSVLVADGSHAVYVPNLWANVAGTGNTVGSTLSIIEGATQRCGAPNTDQSHGTTAQVRGSIGFNLIQTSSLNLGSSNTLQTGAANGSLDVDVAQAEGQLVSPPTVHCSTGAGDPTTFTVDVTTHAASVGLTTHVPVSGTVKVDAVSLAGVSVQISVALNMTVDITASASALGSSGTANIAIPPNDTTPVSIGGVPLALSGVTLVPTIDASNFSATVSASVASLLGVGTTLGLDSSLLTSTLTAIKTKLTDTTDSSSYASKTLVKLTQNIDSGILAPLSKGLGLKIAGADVYGLSATCAAPELAG